MGEHHPACGENTGAHCQAHQLSKLAVPRSRHQGFAYRFALSLQVHRYGYRYYQMLTFLRGWDVGKDEGKAIRSFNREYDLISLLQSFC